MVEARDIFAFRSRWGSVFNTASDPDIAQWLNTAELWVDPAVYTPSDCALAKQCWAAHWLSLVQQQKTNATVDGTGMSDLYVRSIRFGERLVNFAQRSGFQKIEETAGPGEQLMTSTMYGMLYLQIRKRNSIPVMLI